MPVDRTLKVKRYACDFVDCDKWFARPSDLRRHKVLHGEGERKYQCPNELCSFSSEQKGNLKLHLNNQHTQIRMSCGKAGCDKTFTDVSSRTKHRRKRNHIVEEADSNEPSAPSPSPSLPKSDNCHQTLAYDDHEVAVRWKVHEH